MTEETRPKQTFRSIVTRLCEEALAEETSLNPPVAHFYKAGVTISLNRKGSALFREIVAELQKTKENRINFSKKELEHEVVTTIFEGTEALQNGTFDADRIVSSLLERLQEGSVIWQIYLPVAGLELPDRCELSLAGGVVKSFNADEKEALENECLTIWNQVQWEPPDRKEPGIASLVQKLNEAVACSKFWYHIQLVGHAEAAKNQAIDAAMVALDILTFFARLNAIDPETFACRLLNRPGPSSSEYIAISNKLSCTIGSEVGLPLPYTLDMERVEKMTSQPEFLKLQAISCKPNPTQVEQKFLLGIQQYAEATRLPSLGLRLVWYISALETVLAKEGEGDRHKKVEKRVRKLLGEAAAKTVVPLYDKRRKPVHYGYRNRVGNEFISDVDIHVARDLAYSGIVSALSYEGNVAEHDSFLDYIDGLPNPL